MGFFRNKQKWSVWVGHSFQSLLNVYFLGPFTQIMVRIQVWSFVQTTPIATKYEFSCFKILTMNIYNLFFE